MKSKFLSKSIKRLSKRLHIHKIPPIIRNRYVVTAAVFFLWMLIFDSQNVIKQVRYRYQIFEQNRKINYYNEEIAKVNQERDALFGNTATLERFARERYRMVKEGEDLFLVITK